MSEDFNSLLAKKGTNPLINDNTHDKIKDMAHKDDHRENEHGNGSEEMSVGEIIKNFGNLSTAHTDMRFDIMADEAKLYSDIKHYERTESPKPAPKKTTFAEHVKTENLEDLLKTDGHKDSEKPSIFTTNSERPSRPERGSSTSGRTFKDANDERLAKINILTELAELVDLHGVVLSKNYDMDDDYEDMKLELDMHRSIRRKRNGINWLSDFTINAIWGLEIMNGQVGDPFKLEIGGWHSNMKKQVKGNYDVMGELFEKYFKDGQVSPEFRFLWMLVASAGATISANKVKGKSVSQSMEDDPDMINKLRQQAGQHNYTEDEDDLDDYMSEEREVARKQVSDLQNIRNAEQEVATRQAELSRKADELKKMRQNISMQRSDTRSMYSNNPQPQMQPPQIPQTLMNQNDFMRQQNIYNQQRQMQQQEVMQREFQKMQAMQQMAMQMGNGMQIDNESESESYGGESQVNISPNLEQIVSSMHGDGGSRITSVETIDDDDDAANSKHSQVILRRRRRTKH